MFKTGCHCFNDTEVAVVAGRGVGEGAAGWTQQDRPHAQRGQLVPLRETAPLVETDCVNTSNALKSHMITAFTLNLKT